jgi:glycosyltransferase involved in cell wall biosynthesis
VVVTEHNSFYHLGIRALPAHEQAAQRAFIRRWFSDPNIVKVMPVSNDLASVLTEDYAVPERKIHVIPNVAADVFHPGGQPVAHPFRMLLAAVWRPPKDHDVFIHALRSLPSELRQKLMVEWGGYGPDMERIKQRCASELPDVDVRFPGLMSKAQLAQAMRNAHLFVLPTKADNLPCVVLESLCCGTPVVSMHVNGVPELVDKTNGVLVPPSDPTALATILAHCMRGELQFDRAAIAHAALGRYAPDVVGSHIQRVYSAVLSEDVVIA